LSLNLWRISKRKYANRAFSGEGARRVGGRWNSRGQGMVYTSATLSLAALEVFVHMEVEDSGGMLAYIQATAPKTMKIEYLPELPAGWRAIPAPSILAEIGDRWFRAGATAVLAVPSVVIPTEYNYLMNPAHPDFSQVQLTEPQPFELDPRLWKTYEDN
jgi:RES domain-containing protein